MNAPSTRYPEILDDLAAKLAALLEEEGFSSDRAMPIAFRFAELVRRDWGGASIYIPVGAGHDSDNMAREVFLRWNRKNTRELARELGVSERRLRQLYEIGKTLATDEGDDDASDDDDPQSSLL